MAGDSSLDFGLEPNMGNLEPSSNALFEQRLQELIADVAESAGTSFEESSRKLWDFAFRINVKSQDFYNALISQDTIFLIRSLALQCGGWWMFDGEAPIFTPFPEVLEVYLTEDPDTRLLFERLHPEMLSQDAAKVEDSSNSVVKQMCWKSVDGDENKPKKLYLRYYAFDLWTFYSSTTFKVPDHPDSPGSGFATAQKLLKDGWGYV